MQGRLNLGSREAARRESPQFERFHRPSFVCSNVWCQPSWRVGGVEVGIKKEGDREWARGHLIVSFVRRPGSTH